MKPLRSLVAKGVCATAALGLALGIASAPASASVKPGDFITPRNAAKVKELVSPGVYYKVTHGMTMKIVPTQRIEWPPPYREATEKYSGQVRLSRDHRTVKGYVAGQPFPLIDPNDPYVATKIMWNNVFRPLFTDDYDLRFFTCIAHYVRPGKKEFQVNYTVVGHYAGYSLVGRVEVEPMPTDPNFKTSGRLWLFALYPVLSPASSRGNGIVRYRYADPNRGDDSWSYQVESRRVRRINEAILSTATTAASAWNPDHYSGFNAKTEDYDYKLLGDKQMLACVHAVHVPEVVCPTDGGASVCPENWEMRRMYIVEATPRFGRVNALQGKNIIYMDSEIWWQPYVDTYDRKGQLFQNYTWWSTYRDRVVPDARIAIYPFKRVFEVATGSTDIQGGVASQCYLPGYDTPERECWYINMGVTDKEFCTATAMQRAAKSGK